MYITSTDTELSSLVVLAHFTALTAIFTARVMCGAARGGGITNKTQNISDEAADKAGAFARA